MRGEERGTSWKSNLRSNPRKLCGWDQPSVIPTATRHTEIGCRTVVDTRLQVTGAPFFTRCGCVSQARIGSNGGDGISFDVARNGRHNIFVSNRYAPTLVMFVFLSDSVLLRYIRALYFRPSCPHIETRTSCLLSFVSIRYKM